MTRHSDEDPFARFEAWLAEAESSEPSDANAMTLATVGVDGAPSARMVLLKGVDDRGFVFYTNLGSRKAQELAANPRAALCFHWKSRKRQVRIEGTVVPVSDAEADAYFATRPRISQLGAWASKQSQPLQGRFELEARLARVTARHPVGTVPRPPFWSGFRLIPQVIEFWEEGTFRLHMRFVYRRTEGRWEIRELYP
ncbi:MAG: pyridoxamine 5'-phosphate oxidase [Rhodospirillales bacterium]|nr:pyridoxamine 5'-phosphate oxidase [Rhodospirillales bacterium]